MNTYIRLTNYKQSDKKQRVDTKVRAFEEIFGEVVQSVAFVLEKGK